MGTRQDSQASIFLYQGKQFFKRVITPVLAELRPIPPEEVGGPRKFRIQIARDNSHNALCYEARLSFALTMGAVFERQLRFWLICSAKPQRRALETANFANLIVLLREIKSLDLNALPEVVDLRELWEVVNVARHGDGNAAIKLSESRPEFWGHVNDGLKDLYFEAGMRAYKMRISDADLLRYHRATTAFWQAAMVVRPKRLLSAKAGK